MARVVVFAGSGTLGAEVVADALRASDDLDVSMTTEAELSSALARADAIVFPGGSGRSQGRALRARGRRAVVEHVRRGGGYVGICAGAYLAASHGALPYLGLLPLKIVDMARWARGDGTVQLDMTPAAERVLGCEAPRSRMYYYQGPLLALDRAAEAEVEVTPLARFASESDIGGHGTMPGTIAIAAAHVARGRAVVFSPHPELSSRRGRQQLVRAVTWSFGSRGAGS